MEIQDEQPNNIVLIELRDSESMAQHVSDVEVDLCWRGCFVLRWLLPIAQKTRCPRRKNVRRE